MSENTPWVFSPIRTGRGVRCSMAWIMPSMLPSGPGRPESG
jgi:hypothetical protein